MNKTITRAISVATLGLAGTFAVPASATTGDIVAKVAVVTLQSTTSGNNFFLPDSVATVGQCVKDPSGRTLALFPDDERGKAMIAMVQAAYLSGKTLRVRLDDRGGSSGTYCFVSQLSYT